MLSRLSKDNMYAYLIDSVILNYKIMIIFEYIVFFNILKYIIETLKSQKDHII